MKSYSESTVDNVLIDPWSYMSFKGRFGEARNATAWAAPNWISDKQDRRRLQAYMLLESYVVNMGRRWMNDDADEETKAVRREYGDPGLLVDQIVASVVGENFEITVPGAAQPVKDRKEDQAGDGVEAPEYTQLQTLQQWALDEKFNLKLGHNEHQQVKYGDSVVVLGWDSKKERPRMNVWDPGFYFPVWADDGSDDAGFDEEFPMKVHLAYEFERQVGPGNDNPKPHVRRVTYELAPYEDAPEGPLTCWMSDGVWLLETGLADDVYDLGEGSAEWRVQDLDIGIDFIPVVHFPNFYSGQQNWGVSSLSLVLQILDDIGATDTDLQAASAIVGTPPVALSGSNAPKEADGTVISYGPKTVWETGDGTMTVMDTSRSLDALLKYKNELLERLSINSKVPEAMLGRVKPSDVPSGIALWLSFAPHSGMINSMRRIRDDKYRLLLKFALRFMQANGQVKGEIYDATVEFGSYLPADKMETIKMVVEAMNAKINPMSVETAVQMLMEAGLPIEDAQAEIRLIEQRMYEDALTLVQAVGDTNAGRRLLGYEDNAAVIPEEPVQTRGGEDLDIDFGL